jgi:hypothetical protein
MRLMLARPIPRLLATLVDLLSVGTGKSTSDASYVRLGSLDIERPFGMMPTRRRE